MKTTLLVNDEKHVIDVGPDTPLLWVLRDTLAHDASAAERHWQTLLALFDAKLRH